MASSLSDAPQKAISKSQAASAPFLAKLVEAEQARWMLFAPVVLGAGIALWFLLPFVAQRQAALAIALAVAILGLFLSGLSARIVIAGGLLLALGIGAAELRSLLVAAPVLHHRLSEAILTGRVVSVEARAGGDRWRLLLLRDASDIDPAVRIRIALPAKPSLDIEPGARIAIPAILQPRAGPVLPGGYDMARVAWFEGVSASGRATAPPKRLSAAPPGQLWLARQRGTLTAFIQQRIGGDAGRVGAALVTGDQGQVPTHVLDSMRISGLAHLLSVSGFHIAVVAGGALLLFRKLLALWPWFALRVSVRAVAAILAGLILTAYVLLAGAEVPAVRAAIAAWIVLLALAYGRNALSLRLIAFAAFIILMLRPEALLSPSFQLSFAAVTALVLLSDSRFGQRHLKPDPDAGLVQKVSRYGLALIVSGIVAELVLSPVAMAHFGRAGLYGVVANIIAIPLTSLAIMPLLTGFLLSAFVGLEGLIAPIAAIAIDALMALSTRVSAWPGASITVPAIPLQAFGLGVAGALLLCLFSGRLRWVGAPLLSAGIALALFSPRPDLYVSSDGGQVAIVSHGAIHFLRPQRGGFTARAWSEAAAVPTGGLFADLPDTQCSEGGCALIVNGLSIIALRQEPSSSLSSHCATADVVIAPTGLSDCHPRWLLLDSPALQKSGAVALFTRQQEMQSSALTSGDHPWSPSALPGEQQTLLGSVRWTPPLTE